MLTPCYARLIIQPEATLQMLYQSLDEKTTDRQVLVLRSHFPILSLKRPRFATSASVFVVGVSGVFSLFFAAFDLPPPLYTVCFGPFALIHSRPSRKSLDRCFLAWGFSALLDGLCGLSLFLLVAEVLALSHQCKRRTICRISPLHAGFVRSGLVPISFRNNGL